MADDLQYSSSRPENKRKYEERTTPPPPPAASSGPRRTTGFSAPITSHSPDSNPPPSYNSVPPPMDEIQIAKQRAQEIAARLFSNAEAKRPRLENGGPNEDSNDTKGFSSSAPSDLGQKALGHQYGQGGVGVSSMTAAAGYGFQGTSKKIEIPNGRVGVIIGKSGETIKYLQVQSGAKIQVTRDVDADLTSPTRMVELMGTPEQISKAEQLINGVIAQAEAGGSNLVSRRFSGQTGGEQFQMKVPNNKVGLIIGKGGETIKNMQATSGARIQLIPLHLPPGDVSTERTVYIDGTSEQIEAAKQLVNEVISENRLRNPVMSGGYNQQGYRPPQPPSWGPPGPPPIQQTSYGYMQPGAYPGPPPQYNMSQPPYAGYPPQTTSSGWDQTGAPPSQQTTPGSGYDYYSQQTTLQQQAPHGGASTPAESAGYNYNKPPAAPYNQQQGSYASSYSQPPGAPQQSYPQDGYGGGFHTPASQPGFGQSQTNIQPGYDQSQGYNAAPSYGTGVAPAQDGAATAYGAQGGSSQIPPSQQVPTSIQPSPATQQGYTSQQPNTPPSYTAQGSQAGYSATSQPGYGSQPPAQTGYGQSVPLTQPGYGLPQGQKPPGQTSYGQTQPPSSQGGYIQPSSVQSGYAHSQSLPTQSLAAPPDSSHHRPPAGYAQQPYGVPKAAAQPGYTQQQPQQPYGDSYGGGYSQPPGYSNDSNVSGSAHGSYEAAAGAQPVQQSGVAKASPQS